MEITKDFFQPRGYVYPYSDIEYWICPDCGCSGMAEDIDFVPRGRDYDINDPENQIEYICPQCFETNLYIKRYGN